MRVLIVNDDFFILTMLEQILKQTGIENISTAENGFNAYEMAKKKQFDLVLCDLNMPIMDGYECAQKIHSFYEQKQLFQYNEGVKFCPYLVACSAHINEEIESKAKESGFVEVFVCPMTVPTMKELIHVRLHDYVLKQLSG